MKKILLGTTAIVAAGMITPAMAAEKISLGVGGYMEHYIGFSSVEDDTARDFRAFDTQDDTEIHFSGSTTLDNGIKFAVKVEMEAQNDDTGGSIDEGWLDISSASFGNLRIGNEDAAPSLMHKSSPNYGPGYGDADNWIPTANTTINTDSYVTAGMGDENKISYFSPSFAGFSFGASYSPEIESPGTNGMPNGAIAAEGDGYGVAVKYAGEFGGVGVKADYGYVKSHDKSYSGSNGTTGHQVGMNVSVAGFEFGAGVGMTDAHHDSTATAFAASTDTGEGVVWDIGVGYKSGPWGVSLGYVASDLEGVSTFASTENDEMATIALSGTYTMGPGITLHGSVYHADYDEEANVDANFVDGGWAVVAGFSLSF